MNELKYTKTHEWLQMHGDEATIGITEYAQHSLGELVYVELPNEGKTVKAGEELGVVESVKAAADFYAPISGTIVAINKDLSEKPELVNSDPQEKGWLVKILPSNPVELENLLTPQQYQETLEEH